MELVTASDEPLVERLRLRPVPFVDSVRKRNWEQPEEAPQVDKFVLQTNIELPLVRMVTVTVDAPLQIEDDPIKPDQLLQAAVTRTPRSPRYNALHIARMATPRSRDAAPRSARDSPRRAVMPASPTAPKTVQVMPQARPTLVTPLRLSSVTPSQAAPSGRSGGGKPSPSPPQRLSSAGPGRRPSSVSASGFTPRPTLPHAARRRSLEGRAAGRATSPRAADAPAPEDVITSMFRRPKSAGAVQRLGSGIISRAHRILMSYEIATTVQPRAGAAQTDGTPTNAGGTKKKQVVVAKLQRMFNKRLEEAEKRIDDSILRAVITGGETARSFMSGAGGADTYRSPRDAGRSASPGLLRRAFSQRVAHTSPLTVGTASVSPAATRRPHLIATISALTDTMRTAAASTTVTVPAEAELLRHVDFKGAAAEASHVELPTIALQAPPVHRPRAASASDVIALAAAAVAATPGPQLLRRESSIGRSSVNDSPNRRRTVSRGSDGPDKSPPPRARRASIARSPEDVFGPDYAQRQSMIAAARAASDAASASATRSALQSAAADASPPPRDVSSLMSMHHSANRRLSMAAQASPSLDERDAVEREAEQQGVDDASDSGGSDGHPTRQHRSRTLSGDSRRDSRARGKRESSEGVINPMTGLRVRSALIEDADAVIGADVLPGHGPNSTHFGHPRPPVMAVGIFRTTMFSPVSRHRKVALRAANTTNADTAPTIAAASTERPTQASWGASGPGRPDDRDPLAMPTPGSAMPSWGESIDTLRASMRAVTIATRRHEALQRATVDAAPPPPTTSALLLRKTSFQRRAGRFARLVASSVSSVDEATALEHVAQPAAAAAAASPIPPEQPRIVRFGVSVDRDLEASNLFAAPGRAGASPGPPMRPRHVYQNSFGFVDPYASKALRDYAEYRAVHIHGSDFDPVHAARVEEAREARIVAERMPRRPTPDVREYAYAVPTPADYRIAATYTNTREQIMSIVRQQGDDAKRYAAATMAVAATADGGPTPVHSARSTSGAGDATARTARSARASPRRPEAQQQRRSPLKWRPQTAGSNSSSSRRSRAEIADIVHVGNNSARKASTRSRHKRPTTAVDGVDMIRRFMPTDLTRSTVDKRRALSSLARETQTTLLKREKLAQDELAKSLFMPWRQEGYTEEGADVHDDADSSVSGDAEAGAEYVDDDESLESVEQE